MAATAIATKINIDRAHQLYRHGRHADALALYTQALALAKTKPQRIALHSNRAACYLKMQDFRKAAEECTSVLELDHKHTGALMLRAQTLVTLKDFQSALFDVNRLIELNPDSDVYKNLQTRLRTQLALAPIPESEEEAVHLEEENYRTQEEKNKGTEPAGINSEEPFFQAEITQTDSNLDCKPQGWEAIPKPRGHSGLDYSRWNQVEDDSSEDEEEDDDDDEQQPHYRFRVRTVGIKPVK